MTENDRLIQNLESLGEIEACPQSTKRAAEQIRMTLTARPASPPSFNRRMRMSAPAAIIVVVLAGIAVYLPWPISDSTNVAFAQVKQQVQKTRTVQYTNTRFHKVPPETRPGIGKEEVTQVKILGRYLKRIETETTQGEVYEAQVIDVKNGKRVSIHPINKHFVIYDQQEPIDEANLYESFRRIADDVEKLPPKMIGGKKLVGFRETKKQGPETWTRTIWVDPKTKLPVRIDIKSRSTDPRFGPSDWVLSDFVFDVELDASLFSTKPPVGYSVERKSIIGL